MDPWAIWEGRKNDWEEKRIEKSGGENKREKEEELERTKEERGMGEKKGRILVRGREESNRMKAAR